MSGGTEYAQRLVEVEKENERLRAELAAARANLEQARQDLGAEQAAVHQQGEMASGYREKWLAEEKRRFKAESERDAARREAGALRGALDEVVRRAGLPVTPRVTGLPDSPETLGAAIAECVRLAIAHVTEPARALSSSRPVDAGGTTP